MIQAQTIPGKFHKLLMDFANSKITMDGVLYGMLDIIERDVVGADEIIVIKEGATKREDNYKATRNEMRALQRKNIRSDDDDSIILPIALCIDDYRRSILTPNEDQVKQMSIDDTIELLVDAVEKYLLPRGRVTIAKKNKSELGMALSPLYEAQLKMLGIV